MTETLKLKITFEEIRSTLLSFHSTKSQTVGAPVHRLRNLGTAIFLLRIRRWIVALCLLSSYQEVKYINHPLYKQFKITIPIRIRVLVIELGLTGRAPGPLVQCVHHRPASKFSDLHRESKKDVTFLYETVPL